MPEVVAEEKFIRLTSMESFLRVSKYIKAVVVLAVPLPPTISTGYLCFLKCMWCTTTRGQQNKTISYLRKCDLGRAKGSSLDDTPVVCKLPQINVERRETSSTGCRRFFTVRYHMWHEEDREQR